jgi:hypothetical protein
MGGAVFEVATGGRRGLSAFARYFLFHFESGNANSE